MEQENNQIKADMLNEKREKQVTGGSIGASFPEVLYPERCNRCTICLEFCKPNSIYITDIGPEIDYCTCNGCLVCINECPLSVFGRVSRF